jgi:hypothetical protein
MKSGYSFIELAELHLVLEECNGKVVEAVTGYRERYLTQRVLNRRTFICVDHRLRDAECDGMLVVHIVYGWKCRSSRSLEGSLPWIPDVFKLINIPPMLQYTVDYNSQSVHELVPNDEPTRCVSVNEFCNTRPTRVWLQQMFSSRINCISLRTGSPTFTTKCVVRWKSSSYSISLSSAEDFRPSVSVSWPAL